ncbi:HypC/HybG/HupF family hydrogenase formation chaperone [Ignicoccus hospitalis]|uniref:Hydrogenase assembly chaperone hypC/hupF n=1 Tax=Ignicoccus hospitalis (strain KIN4/I / DSM 18386 / JCM 14125) TaxID=453591 RepID=A8AA02_IGNH4|nr:HypC/HybG/HupF family hydrogenase formation chaperone [Ignicoccus hospitalis]ABU81754.1 hydrogenase assembly chaperone hypC/hupF [Ignicoccus hospitalis KIN4/I]HIH90022.1 HypC/HybG/HupF family hydrogenase formation chaperone [Desulfurococcaceae archaeon]
MCLGIPATVKEVYEDGTAAVDVFGNEAIVDLTLVPDVKPGDKVIVHAGAAIAKVDEERWREAYELWKQVLETLDKLYEEQAQSQ